MPQQSTDADSYNRLILVVVQDQDADGLSDSFNEAKIAHTRLKSAGGFLQTSNTVFMIAMDAARCSELKDLVRATCSTRTEFVTVPWVAEVDYVQPVEVEVGGATVFELSLEQVERIGNGG